MRRMNHFDWQINKLGDTMSHLMSTGERTEKWIIANSQATVVQIIDKRAIRHGSKLSGNLILFTLGYGAYTNW